MEWLAPPQCRKALIKASKIKTKNILRFLTNFLPSELYPGYLGIGLACPVGWHFGGIGLMLLGCRGACFVTLPLWEQEDKSWWEKASGNPNRPPAAFRETRTKITTSRHTLQQHFTIGLFPLSVTALFFFLFFFPGLQVAETCQQPAAPHKASARSKPEQSRSRRVLQSIQGACCHSASASKGNLLFPWQGSRLRQRSGVAGACCHLTHGSTPKT